IAFALIHFARRPTGLPYARVFVAFAVFIIADGATHLSAVWSVCQPSAWLATLLKMATALASVSVALVLPPLVPKALGLGVARAQAEEIGRRASFLAEDSRVLAASLDYEATLRSVARVAIPYLADYLLVDVLETQGRLRRLAAAHRDPGLEERLASAPGQAP